MSYQVTVSQLSSTSSEKSINEFFSFCGRISNITYDETSNTAHVTFEKQQAAKTALMLNGGTLDGATIHVGSDSVTEDQERPTTAERDHIEQHDKPRAGIVAEMLAKGYVLTDTILHKAIEVDQKQGISTRFINFIRGLDAKLGQGIGGPGTTVSGQAKQTLASGKQRAATLDEQHGITQRVQTFDQQHGISRQATDYYSKAIASPVGQKILAFYTQTTKQVQDVHEEAMRIALLEKEKQSAHTGSSSAAPTESTTVHDPASAVQ